MRGFSRRAFRDRTDSVGGSLGVEGEASESPECSEAGAVIAEIGSDE